MKKTYIIFSVMLTGLLSGCGTITATTTTNSNTNISSNRQAEITVLVQKWIDTQDDNLIHQLKSEQELRFAEGVIQQIQDSYTNAGFSVAQGRFTAKPTVKIVGDQYTITWSTTDNYPNNEVVMKSSESKYPDAGVGAYTNYDVENNVYVYTGQFRLTDSKADSNMPVFAPGNYSYQVKSVGLDDQDQIVSPVLDLDASVTTVIQ